MPNCGTTGLIPDCLEAQNSTWKITYNVPSSGYVRYKYPNGNWVNVIGGVRYTTEQQASELSSWGESGKMYRITVEHTRNGTGCDSHLQQKFISNIANALMAPISAGFDEAGMQWYYNNRVSCSGSTSQFPQRLSFVSGRNAQGNQRKETVIYYRAIYELSQVTKIIKLVEQATGQEWKPPAQNNCIFKVFNANNQIIFERTDSVCPTAEVVPCHYLPENERSINVNPAEVGLVPLIAPKGLNVYYDVELGTGRKATFVKIVSFPGSTIPGGEITLLKLISPKGCSLHPRICWQCDPCRSCPESTCLKVLNRENNKICCYDKTGKVIAVVMPDCDTYECVL
jgi:hypothetical protein